MRGVVQPIFASALMPRQTILTAHAKMPLLGKEIAAYTSASPVQAGIVQGFGLFFVGEVIAQTLRPDDERGAAGAAARTIKAAAWGALYTGFVIASWYRLIDRLTLCAIRVLR